MVRSVLRQHFSQALDCHWVLITREGTSLHCAAGKSMLGKGLSGITGQ